MIYDLQNIRNKCLLSSLHPPSPQYRGIVLPCEWRGLLFPQIYPREKQPPPFTFVYRKNGFTPLKKLCTCCHYNSILSNRAGNSILCVKGVKYIRFVMSPKILEMSKRTHECGRSLHSSDAHDTLCGKYKSRNKYSKQ